MGYWPVNERIILCKFEAKPFNIVIMQVYAPTSDYPDEKIAAFYDDVSKTLKQAKSSDVVIVMGDFNAKVGNTAMSKSIGRYGLGTSNERGERVEELRRRLHSASGTGLTQVGMASCQPAFSPSASGLAIYRLRSVVYPSDIL
ncbi:craniofacial development protein 2-like [Elysia marginata]|uniref:Craniofacial development protein 2-like n=1 Tax=Elysia marginata TaxID=1093978 RepID=A0AAV4GVF9_9GAST|nr:craniofacial development protein 2-like [Elysia marginata]